MSCETWTETDSINLTAQLVILDGHRLRRLTTAERIAAIDLAVARGMDRDALADRLGTNLDALTAFARRYQLTLPPRPGPDPWAQVAYPSRRPAVQKRYRRGGKTRQLAAA